MSLRQERVLQILDSLEIATRDFPLPMSELISKEYGKDPYLILISCLLSLRARDVVTYPVSKNLFRYVRTPQQMLEIPNEKLTNLIHSIGFYNRKAAILKDVSRQLIERFSGQVPHTEAELLSLKGVGRKTANLVLSVAFDTPAICVDVHVHRLSNRLGIVTTKTPEQTEAALKKIVPKERWSDINRLLVQWGQNVCLPVLPKCSQCVLAPICPKIGVVHHR